MAPPSLVRSSYLLSPHFQISRESARNPTAVHSSATTAPLGTMVPVAGRLAAGTGTQRRMGNLSRALALSAGARMEVISSPVLSGVGVRGGVLGRDLDADAGAGAALVRQGGHPQRGRPVQGW